MEYMDTHWHLDFDRDKLAEIVNLSPDRFTHLFKQHTGMAAHEYYREMKIEKIREKLCDPELTITEAFRACGTDAHGRYGHYFKEIVGMTPSEYRKNLQIRSAPG
jgi:transcriptional regulator GlxA family with amidase domain